MQNATNIRRVVSWNTTKTAAGFKYTVYSLDYEQPTTIHFQGTCTTRAKAVAAGKQGVRYVDSIRAKLAA